VRAISECMGVVMLTMPETKICQMCGQAFPATTEFWHRRGRGLQPRCGECACAYSREWYKSHPERARINHQNSSSRRSAQRAERRSQREAAYVAPTHRVCNVCRGEFPLISEFWPQSRGKLDYTCRACAKKRARDWYLANLERARAANRKNREEHPEKVVARRIRYRDENPEKIRSSHADFYRRNREKRIAYSAQWRLDNPEKAAASRKREYENNKELAKQRARDWVQANPERVKLRTARRRAAQKDAPGHFTEADLVRQFEKQQGRCFYCHEDLQGAGTIDHYIPLSKGGTNYPSNIVLACWPCNNRKRAKLPSEFRPRLEAVAPADLFGKA